jgi:Xaa-Pro aminopeptidase
MSPSVYIPASEFAKRRQRLLKKLGQGSIAIVPAATHQIRNRDAEYPFRQNSDFHYLTDFPEADAVAVLIPNRAEGEFVLFCLPKDPHAERWTGIRVGVEDAKARYGADQAFLLDELDQRLPQLLMGCERVYYDLGLNSAFDQRMIGYLNQLRQQARAGVQIPHTLTMLERFVHDMRLFKSPAEIKLMRHAAQTSARAHSYAMQICEAGLYEYELDAVFAHEFRQDNMQAAYTTIVGGGKNACILHYIENNARLNDGDLVLIDAGAEYACYASDITRTFPVNGKFSPEQRALYQIVLDAQQAAIAAAQAGNTWDDPHQAAVKVLAQGLIELGILQGSLEDALTAPATAEGEPPKEAPYRQFYMHRTGHWLGLDVHDVGDYKVNGQWRILQPGMVLTVEPGLYISPAENVDPKWWHIGIRIEDDVLITKTGNEILTKDVVKEIAEIEALMAH